MVLLVGEGLDPITLAYYNQYASSPSSRAHYYTELAISSPVVSETIAITYCTYSQGTVVQRAIEWPGLILGWYTLWKW